MTSVCDTPPPVYETDANVMAMVSFMDPTPENLGFVSSMVSLPRDADRRALVQRFAAHNKKFERPFANPGVIARAMMEPYTQTDVRFVRFLGMPSVTEFRVIVARDGEDDEAMMRFFRGSDCEMLRDAVRAQEEFNSVGLAPHVASSSFDCPGVSVVESGVVSCTLKQLLCHAGDDRARVSELADHVSGLLSRLYASDMTYGSMGTETIGFVVRDGSTRALLTHFDNSNWMRRDIQKDVSMLLSELSRDPGMHLFERVLTRKLDEKPEFRGARFNV